jgi:hypothetical protein
MRISILLFQLIIAKAAIAQSDTILPQKIWIAGIEETVSKIRQNESSYKKAVKYRDSLGARTAFTKDGELMFTRAEIQEPTVKKKVEWYFDHGQIIFCEQVWTLIGSEKIFNHERIYLKDGKMLQWLNTQDQLVDPKSNAFRETEFYLLEYSKTLLKEAAEN